MRNTFPANIYNIFSATECFYLYRKVHYYANLWDLRDYLAPWYTFGPAAYLDAKDGKFKEYLDKAGPFKVIFDEAFKMEKETLLKALRREVNNEPMGYHAFYMPFGFHIFLAHEVFLEDNVGSIHMDKQEELLKWEGPVEEKLSLTIPICMPKAGAGLNFWVGDKREYWDYSLGTGVIHYGNLKHQIASAKAPIEKYDERLTLQVHAAKVNGTWLIHR